MKSAAYVIWTISVMTLINFGWNGGQFGHGYIHLTALLVAGFIGGCIYKTIRQEIREENALDEHAENHYNGTRYI